VQLYLAVFGM